MKLDKMRVMDLPIPLKRLIENMDEAVHIMTTDLAKPYLDKLDWTKCSDAERLAYCEVVYTGKEVICLVDGHRYDGLKLRTQYSKNEVWVNGEINGDAGWSVCLYKNGKFAEIISDEVKEPLFKVGDHPKWTPELIKQLPHGTVLECAVIPGDLYTWKGQEILTDSTLDFYIDEPKNNYYLTDGKNYAKIISLPETKSIKEKLKGTCVLNESVEIGAEIVKLYTEAGFSNHTRFDGSNTESWYGEEGGEIVGKLYCFGKGITLDQLRSIVRGEKAESVEFKEGEMVEYCYWQHLGRKGWKECRYTGGKTKDGLFVVECDGEFVASPEIRKIDQDPHGFLKTANEIISERIQHKPFHEDSVRDMLIEAMKRVKK